MAVVGGGIVGLAIAWTLQRRDPGAKVILLEKETQVGQHQTSHNSGVVHSGAFYRPGSAKARCSMRGRGLLLAYCEARSIPVRRIGKLVVALRSSDLPMLEQVRRRARENGVSEAVSLSLREARRIEPEVGGQAAVYLPSTSIVDFAQVARHLAAEVEAEGGQVVRSAEVQALRPDSDSVRIGLGAEGVEARFVVNCAGLYSDRIAALAGVDAGVRIVPFRGEFFRLRPGRDELVSHLVYPAPDPVRPFVGIHFTPMVGGGIEIGPNAVLATSREGYRRSDFRVRDVAEMIGFPGFHRMVLRNLPAGAYEAFRSLSLAQFARDAARLVPALRADDLVPMAAGVRAQAVARNGDFVDDFLVADGPRSLHLLNAPSPAATSAFAIAEELVDRIPRRS